MNWQEKTVFITGASSGIGEALSIALARKGAVLGLVARRETLLHDLAKKCEQAGGSARVYACDVIDAEKLVDAAESFRNEFGKIDVMIANAGIGASSKDARDLIPYAVKQVVDTNLMGAVNAVHAVLPDMLEKRLGHLVAIS